MNRNPKRIKKQSKKINEVSYAVIQKPTNAAFIPKEIMERNSEKKSVRQKGKVVYVEWKLAENKKTKRQEEKKGHLKTMEDPASGIFA